MNVIAEVSITYSHRVKPSEQVKICGSCDVYNSVKHMWPDIDYRESMAVLLLSRSNKILGLSFVSHGGVSGTVCDAKLIFQTALKSNASAIILIHNHPSGELFPSDADRKLTQKVIRGAEYLDIKVLDHQIITSEGYYSFADDGLMY